MRVGKRAKPAQERLILSARKDQFADVAIFKIILWQLHFYTERT
jgi:hypothetical protein